MIDNKILFADCCVIGCGISGIAVARWLKQYNFDFVVFEKSEDIAGLWRYRENDYGVMSFTHINVSKYNYCFSDHPFPEDSVEFMHHKHIYEYAKSYMKIHNLDEYTKFNHEVTLVEEIIDKEELGIENVKFPSIEEFDKLWKVKVKDNLNDQDLIYVTPYVAVCSGHHSKPKYVEFPGQESFKGEIIHSVKFKNAKLNNMEKKNVLLIGIGNSSVDAADNLVTQGDCPNVTISSRSGAWVLPNYVNGFPIDLYPNRFFLKQPWRISTQIFESIVKLMHGDPRRYDLNPKSRAFQYHPTVSPVLYHHIQRKRVKIQPDIKEIKGKEVTFLNNEKEEFDSVILCTGYKIGIDFLSNDLKKLVFDQDDDSFLNLYKLVFCPKIGSSLAFIGYVQPHTGGILPISEIQARWFVYLMAKKIKLPSESEMNQDVSKFKRKVQERFYKSSRHTLQQDPILYNDEIAGFFGAKPSLIRNYNIAWRILFSSCGTAQWRINGPDKMPNAAEIVKGVPVPTLNKFMFLALVLILCSLSFLFALHPLLFLFTVLSLSYFFILNQKD